MVSFRPCTITVWFWFQLLRVNVSVVEAPYAALPLFTWHSVLSSDGRATATVTFADGCIVSRTLKLSVVPVSLVVTECWDSRRDAES